MGMNDRIIDAYFSQFLGHKLENNAMQTP